MRIELLNAFWSDIHETNLWWQIAVIILCVLASYFLTRFLSHRFPDELNSRGTEAIAAQSFLRVIFPAVLVLFLYVGKCILIQWQHVNLLSLLVPICGGWALMRFGIFLSRRIFAHGEAIGSLHLVLEKLFSWGVWIAVLFYYTGLLQELMVFMEKTTIFTGRNKLSVLEILQALISVVLTVLLALWASAALDKRLMKVSSLHTSSRLVMSRLGRSLLIILAILISLNLVGIDITVLSIFSGALGVGLGFGLQKIASNYVSGFIILLDRSLAINDLITVDKYSGKVTEINTRYTVLKGQDGIESVIPNEMLVSGPVQNFSLTDREVWLSTDVSVAYSTDIEALLPLLVEAVRGVNRVSTKLPPSANLVNFGASGLDLRIGFWINDPENGRLSVLSNVNRAIWKLLQEHDIEVPFPQTEIRVLGSDSAQRSPILYSQ